MNGCAEVGSWTVANHGFTIYDPDNPAGHLIVTTDGPNRGSIRSRSSIETLTRQLFTN